jgi:hypothetical protein
MTGPNPISDFEFDKAALPFIGYSIRRRLSQTVILACMVALNMLHAQTDWPVFGHDPGGMRYSPLKQINASNVGKLKLAWTFDTEVAGMPPPPLPAGRRGSDSDPAAAGRRGSDSEAPPDAPARADPKARRS